MVVVSLIHLLVVGCDDGNAGETSADPTGAGADGNTVNGLTRRVKFVRRAIRLPIFSRILSLKI